MSYGKRFSLKPYVFLLPTASICIVFKLYPFINTLFMALREDYNYLANSDTGIGFKNFEILFSDQYFESAIKNTLIYTVFAMPISVMIAILMGYLLRKNNIASKFFQTAYFLPIVTSIISVASVFRVIYAPQGILNAIIDKFGINAVDWLNDPEYSMLALLIFGIWFMMPNSIILTLCGYFNIPQSYILAAKIDGASKIKIFFKIYLPMLSPVILITAISNTMSSFMIFDYMYVLFRGSPGPAYNLYTVVYYIYEKMHEGKFGYGLAAAAAIILFLMIFICTLIQLLLPIIARRKK